MGGDEFVIVAPGLSSEAAIARGVCLSELATAAGREVCGEEILSLSLGCSNFPDDGMDAEKLLAEADRRMYIEKQEHHARAEKKARGASASGPFGTLVQ
jgi:diguanylate cyclase (GGDEF)-like protein